VRAEQEREPRGGKREHRAVRFTVLSVTDYYRATVHPVEPRKKRENEESQPASREIEREGEVEPTSRANGSWTA